MSQFINFSSRRMILAIAWLVLQASTNLVSSPAASAETFRVPPAGLVDQNGRPYSGVGEPGSLRLIFFGYTHCPDVCPTTLSDISLAVSSLDPDLRERVHPIFVTADPKRDEPDVLQAYLESFGPAFVGITGTAKAIDTYAWENGIYIVRNDGSDPVSYTVDHATSLLAIAEDGTVLDRISYGVSVEELARRIEIALRAGKRG